MKYCRKFKKMTPNDQIWTRRVQLSPVSSAFSHSWALPTPPWWWTAPLRPLSPSIAALHVWRMSDRHYSHLVTGGSQVRLTCGAGRPWKLCLWKSLINQNYCWGWASDTSSVIFVTTLRMRREIKDMSSSLYCAPVISILNCRTDLNPPEGSEGRPRYLEVWGDLCQWSPISHHLNRAWGGFHTCHRRK